jgi:hypothetical protein
MQLYLYPFAGRSKCQCLPSPRNLLKSFRFYANKRWRDSPNRPRPTIYPLPSTSSSIQHGVESHAKPLETRVLLSRDVLKRSLTATPVWGHFWVLVH